MSDFDRDAVIAYAREQLEPLAEQIELLTQAVDRLEQLIQAKQRGEDIAWKMGQGMLKVREDPNDYFDALNGIARYKNGKPRF